MSDSSIRLRHVDRNIVINDISANLTPGCRLSAFLRRDKSPEERQIVNGIRRLAHALHDTRQSAIQKAERRTRLIVCAVAGVIGAVLLGVLMLTVRVGEQNVRLEIDDPNAAVFVDGEQVRIEKLGATIVLKPGEHGVEVRQGDKIIEARPFTVVRGNTTVLKLEVPGANPRPARPTVSPATNVDLTSEKLPPGFTAGPELTRQIASWCLASGISIRVKYSENGKSSSLRLENATDPLPDGPLQILSIGVTKTSTVRHGEWRVLRHVRDSLQSVGLFNTSLSAAHLEILRGARELSSVSVQEAALNDELTRHLASLPKLSSLHIGDGRDLKPNAYLISDDLFETMPRLDADLSKLTTLSSLYVRGCNVSEKTFQSVAQLKKLSLIHIGYCVVTSQALAPLREIPNLLQVNMEGTPLGSKHTDALGDIDGLKYLYLRGTRIGNDQLKPIGKLSSLRKIDFVSSNVSDAGIDYLDDLELDSLWVTSTKVSRTRAQRFKNEHPDCDVVVANGIEGKLTVTSVSIRAPSERREVVTPHVDSATDFLVMNPRKLHGSIWGCDSRLISVPINPDGSVGKPAGTAPLPEVGHSRYYEVTAHPTKPVVYVSLRETGYLCGFSVGRDGSLKRLPNMPMSLPEKGGYAPYHHTAITPDGRFLYVSYVLDLNNEEQASWKMAGYRIDPDGQLSAIDGVLPHRGRLKTVRLGPVVTHPSNRFLYVVTRKSDKENNSQGLFGFRIESTGRLTLLPGAPFASAPPKTVRNGNPSLSMDPLGEFLFLLNWDQAIGDGERGDSWLLSYRVNASTGALTADVKSPMLLNGRSGARISPLGDTGEFLIRNGSPGRVTAWWLDRISGKLVESSGSTSLPSDSHVLLGMGPRRKFFYTGRYGRGIDAHPVDAAGRLGRPVTITNAVGRTVFVSVPVEE